MLREAKERCDRERRPLRRWRHLDVGWTRCPKHARRCVVRRLEAVEGAFGSDIDYAMLIKIYGPSLEGRRRYSPAECIGAVKHRGEGNSDPNHVSTSYSERQNLNIRMGNRRMTRLTNAFSKKAANHKHMMAITTISFAFIKRSKSLPQWPPALHRSFGKCRTWLPYWKLGKRKRRTNDKPALLRRQSRRSSREH